MRGARLLVVLGALAGALPTARLLGVEPPIQSPRVVEALRRVSVERLRHDVQTLAGFGTRHVLSETDSPRRGVGAARRYLRAELENAAAQSHGRMTVLEFPFARSFGRRQPQSGRFVNLIARLRGTTPRRGAWVFSGHYDSRNGVAIDGKGDAPGADDDASGTAVILEMARILATAVLPADVYLCAFDGEELGLFGSDHFAESLRSEGRIVEGMITNDIVGASTGPDGVCRGDILRCFSEGFSTRTEVDRTFRNFGAETEGVSRQLARYAALLGQRYPQALTVKLIYRGDRFGRGGDHLSFTRRGYPGIRFTEAAENYHHQHQNVRVENGLQYGDLPEFMDFVYLARVTQTNLAVALNGAAAPPPPARVHLRGAVRHDTVVEWSAVESSNLAGYRVWRRPTDQPRWGPSVFVAEGTERHVFSFISIDDWQFGVSSVGQDGTESPVCFPTPPPHRPRRKL